LTLRSTGFYDWWVFVCVTMARPPKITTEEIIIVARQVFLEQGAGASTLVIAGRAGISEAAIFKRFGTKQALFLAAMGISNNHPWVNVLSQGTPTPAIRTDLIDICSQILEVYREVMPRVLMLMNQGNTSFPPPMFEPPPIRDAQLLTGYLDRAIDRGYIKSCNAIVVAHVIIGGINSYVIMENIPRLPFPVSSLLQNKSITSGGSVAIEPELFIPNLIDTIWVGIDPNS
jgi:AcrR family transcriptional regulator